MCLRYDNGERQRESFLREAKMSANLTHDNILKLHGVVLAGSYTTSVALVSITSWGGLCSGTKMIVRKELAIIQSF